MKTLSNTVSFELWEDPSPPEFPRIESYWDFGGEVKVQLEAEDMVGDDWDNEVWNWMGDYLSENHTFEGKPYGCHIRWDYSIDYDTKIVTATPKELVGDDE